MQPAGHTQFYTTLTDATIAAFSALCEVSRADRTPLISK
jgi:hypothetical protein